MARIRSIHPGLFTDEAYMALSLAAKAAWPGIWTEADDAGVIEWKPLTLKARILPAEAVDMAGILTELEARGLLVKFSVDGKDYAVIRGFGRWQRPKKPLYRFPLPEGFHTFAAYQPKSSPPVPNQSATPTPQPEQREEEGGRMEDEGGKEEIALALKIFSDAAQRQGWPDPRGMSEKRERKLTARLAEHGLDGWRSAIERAEKSEFLRAKWKLKLDWLLEAGNFAKVIEGNYDDPGGEPKPTSADPNNWAWKLEWFRTKGMWNTAWGPKPGDPGCFAPKEAM